MGETRSEEVIWDKHLILNFIARTGIFGDRHCNALIDEFRTYLRLNECSLESYEIQFVMDCIHYLEQCSQE